MDQERTAMKAPTVDTSQVERLLRAFFRILMACSVDKAMLEAACQIALEQNESTLPPGETLTASALQHLACTDLVFRWRRDSRFLDAQGYPKKLTIQDGEDSFPALCGLIDSSYEPQELLRYLEAVGTVRVVNDRAELLAESVLACKSDEGKTISPRTVLSHLQGFIGSVEHNLFRPERSENGRFERACYAEVPKELVPIFERFAEVRGQNLVDAVDDWLSRHHDRITSLGDTQKSLVGIGAYVVVHDSNVFKTDSP